MKEIPRKSTELIALGDLAETSGRSPAGVSIEQPPDLAAKPHHDSSTLYVSTLGPILADVMRVRVGIPDG